MSVVSFRIRVVEAERPAGRFASVLKSLSGWSPGQRAPHIPFPHGREGVAKFRTSTEACSKKQIALALSVRSRMRPFTNEWKRSSDLAEPHRDTFNPRLEYSHPPRR